MILAFFFLFFFTFIIIIIIFILNCGSYEINVWHISTCQISLLLKWFTFLLELFFFFIILWVIIYLILSNCHSLLSLFLFMGFTFCTIWVPFLLFYLVGIWCRLGHIRFYFSHVKKNLIRIIFASYNHDKIVILFSLCVVNCIFT